MSIGIAGQSMNLWTHFQSTMRLRSESWPSLPSSYQKAGPDIRIFGYAAERCVKSYVTGRKNFLFHDTVNGARSSAIIYSLVETAKANHLNVFQYLYTLLLYIPDYKEEPTGMESMMPWSDFIKERCTSPMGRRHRQQRALPGSIRPPAPGK